MYIQSYQRSPLEDRMIFTNKIRYIPPHAETCIEILLSDIHERNKISSEYTDMKHVPWLIDWKFQFEKKTSSAIFTMPMWIIYQKTTNQQLAIMQRMSESTDHACTVHFVYTYPYRRIYQHFKYLMPRLLFLSIHSWFW